MLARFLHKFLNKDLITKLLPKRNKTLEKFVNNSILQEFVKFKKSKDFVNLHDNEMSFDNEFKMFSKNVYSDSLLCLEYSMENP